MTTIYKVFVKKEFSDIDLPKVFSRCPMVGEVVIAIGGVIKYKKGEYMSAVGTKFKVIQVCHTAIPASFGSSFDEQSDEQLVVHLYLDLL